MVLPKQSNDSAPNIYNIYVDYQDTDAGQVVYHTSYIDFAERARGHFWRSLGYDVAKQKNYWIIAELNAKYIAPARLGDLLTIKSYVNSIGKASIKMSHNIYVKNQLLVILLVKLAYINSDFTIQQMTKDMIENFSKYNI